MARPQHTADTRTGINQPRTFFVTTQTAGRRPLFQTDRMATLLIDVLRAQVKSGKFTIHDFVVMPDHVHILLTTPGELTIEKAVQLIKGTFSFRANKELGFPGEVWQKGFSELLVTSREIFLEHRRYIEQNPVKAGLVTSLEKYPYSSRSFKALKASMAKS